MIKLAEGGIDSNTELRALLLGGAATSIGVNLLLHRHLKKTLDRTPNLDAKQLPKVYESAGIDKNFPTFPVKNLENAYYASPWQSFVLPKEVREKLAPHIKEKMKELGHIGYDPKYNKAGIIAHEAGHAAIRTTKPWYNPSRLNQSVFRTISDITLPLAGSVGLATGIETQNPLYGALAGLGTAGVLGAPTLINEHQATGYAKRYLDDSKLKPQTKTKNKKVLNKAFSTYALGALLGPTLTGGIGGAWSHHMNT